MCTSLVGVLFDGSHVELDRVERFDRGPKLKLWQRVLRLVLARLHSGICELFEVGYLYLCRVVSCTCTALVEVRYLQDDTNRCDLILFYFLFLQHFFAFYFPLHVPFHVVALYVPVPYMVHAARLLCSFLVFCLSCQHAICVRCLLGSWARSWGGYQPL